MRRLITLVLLCAFVIPFIPSCAVLTPGSTTQPVQNEVAWLASQYDYWRARADLLAKLAAGPNPDPNKVKEYQAALWYVDWFRSALVLAGAPVPA